MTNTTAIQALIDAVEAGRSLSGLEIDLDDRPDVSIAMWDMVVSAHNGSLDAAMALHKAVLGDGYIGEGFNFTIYGSGKVAVWNIITDQSGHGEIKQRDLHEVCQARAWLLAILRAMLTQK